MSVTVVGYLAKSGWNVYLFALDGTGKHSVLSAVNSNPTIYVDGSPVTVSGPTWTNSTLNTSFLVYRLPYQVAASHVISFSASSGWFTCAAGSAPSATGQQIINSSGMLEPGIGSFADFGPVPGFQLPANRTLQLGYCNSWPGGQNPGGYFTMFRNWLKRGTWSNVTQYDSYGHPQIISATSSSTPVNIGVSNYIDSLGIPTPTGQWYFVYDETDPGSPMTVTGSIYAPGYGTLSVSGPFGGTTVNGVLVGRYYIFTVAYTGYPTPSNFNIQLTINVHGSGSGGSGNWTIQNERFVQPGDLLATTDPYTNTSGTPVPGSFALNSIVQGWMTTPSGNGPGILRSTGLDSTFDGQCAAVDSADLAGPYEFSYDNSPRTISVSSIRPYVVGSGNSQYVWYSYEWPGTPAVGGGPAPYAVAPSSINYLNFSGGDTDWFVGEIVTTSAHNLKTGSFITLDQNNWASVTVANGNLTPVTINMNGMILQVFVTSATTFAFTAYGGYGTFTNFAYGPINNINISQSISGSCTEAIPDQGSWSIQATGNWGQTWGKTVHEIPVPIGSNPTLWAAQATLLLNNSTPGSTFVLELSDEIWSNDFATVVASAYAVLGILSAQVSGAWPNYITYQVAASALLRQTFFNVFNAAGRGNEIKLTLNGQGSYSAGPTTWQVEAVNAYNAANPTAPCIWDFAGVASVYPTCPYDSTITTAFSSIYSQEPASYEYQSTTPWTRQMGLEYLRHYIKYRMDFMADLFAPEQTWFPTAIAALKNYIPVGGQPAGFTPVMWIYECAWQNLCPNISGSDSTLQNKLAMDLFYDPEMLYNELALYGMMQYVGCQYAAISVVCMGQLNSAPANMWGHYHWAGQQFGYGDGSDGKAINIFWPVTNRSNDLTNVSIVGLAYQLWQNQGVTGSNVAQISASGTTQSTGTPLPIYETPSALVISNVSAGAGVTLQPCTSPAMVLIINESQNSLYIYPPLNGTINGGSVNSPITMNLGSKMSFWAIHSTTNAIDWQTY